MWTISHFYLKKNVFTVSPMNAGSVGVLGFSINGVDYLLNDVKLGHCLSFDFPQNIATTRTCVQEGYL